MMAAENVGLEKNVSEVREGVREQTGEVVVRVLLNGSLEGALTLRAWDLRVDRKNGLFRIYADGPDGELEIVVREF